MTKEEILQKEYASRIMNWEKAYKQQSSIFEAAHAAMNQYAEQEAISFAEWIATKSWYTPHYGKWIHLREGLDSIKTTSELYNLYKHQSVKP